MNRGHYLLVALSAVLPMGAFFSCGPRIPAATAPSYSDASPGDAERIAIAPAEAAAKRPARPNRPKLGYTVATYAKHELAGSVCAKRFDLLKQEGFAIVTMTPSYVYKGAKRPASKHASVRGDASAPGPAGIIDNSIVPSVTDMSACIGEAYARGLEIAFKPHLDGGDRGTFDFDPAADDAYFDRLIKPHVDAFDAFRSRTRCTDCSFTLYLGTELRTSVDKYPAGWLSVLKQTREYIATKDFPIAPHVTNDLLFDIAETVAPNATLAQFIGGLDSFSLSQYTRLDAGAKDGGVTTVNDVRDALIAHEQSLRAYFVKLGLANAETFPINYGEFGIGSGGLAKPWDYAPTTRDHAQVAIGIEGTLAYLATKTDSSTMAWANLWTVGISYDIMGNDVGPDGGATRYGGETVVAARDAIEAYNAGY